MALFGRHFLTQVIPSQFIGRLLVNRREVVIIGMISPHWRDSHSLESGQVPVVKLHTIANCYPSGTTQVIIACVVCVAHLLYHIDSLLRAVDVAHAASSFDKSKGRLPEPIGKAS